MSPDEAPFREEIGQLVDPCGPTLHENRLGTEVVVEVDVGRGREHPLLLHKRIPDQLPDEL